MIQAKNLKKVYKTKGGVIVNALDGVSVKLPDTGMVFILGKSGSGKSTLLNVLGGLDSFDSGEIIIKGCSAKDFKQTHYDSYRNTYIGFIFQEYNVLEELTVGANVALAIELQGRKATNEEINKILCEVDLEGYGARKPNELSGGQKQRVAIARALVKNPEIIMADEPTGALDSATGRQVFDTLKKLSKDKLVLIVSHDREFSEQYADRIIELKDGVIISDVEKSEEAYEQEQTEQENISYSGNEIKIEKGYFLTEEDRIAINKYLSEINDGVTVSVSEKNQGKKISSADFIPTDESKIKSEKDDNFRLIKSKLSLKNAFKLGSGGLKHKKFRLVFTIFLSVISFLLFGLADTIAAYNNIQTATQSIYDTGVNYASYVKSLKHTWGDDEDDFYWSNDGALLSAADMQKITEATGGKIVGVFSRVRDLNFGESLGSLDEDKHNLSAVYSQGFSGVTAINQQILGELGLELVGEKSRLPQEGKNEIVVPLFIYDLFAYTGYAQKTDNGQVDVEIKNPEDLIGKTLNISLKQVQGMYGGEISSNEEYTIVGILDTKFDYERYKALLDINAELTLSTIEYMALTQELYSAREYSLACVGFVSPDKLEGLVDKATNGPQYFNGNLTIFDLKNSNIVNSIEDIWENYENITNQYNYQNIIKLDKIQDDVLWLGNSLETLGDNQIIISLELYNSLMNSDLYSGGKEDILHTENVTFTDFEQIAFNKINNFEWDMSRFSTLYGLVGCVETLSYYKYAWSNIETVRPLVIQYYVDNGMRTPEEADSIPDDQIINEYVRCTKDGILENQVDRAYIESYREEIIAKYNLSDYFLTKAERAKLMATVTYEGETFTANASVETKSELSMNYVSIFLRKYAYENPTDVVNYYNAVQSGNGKEQLVGVRFNSMAEMYVNFLRGKYFGSYYIEKTEVDYEPQSDVNVVKYVNSSYAQFINSTAGKEQLPKFALYADNYRGKQEFLRNVEIVGVNVGSYTETVTVGPKFYNFLVGSSEGGIFSFATGKMPTDINQIGDIVKYTKTYENKGARYDLKNNVTEQLDMVDEILEILGQVFLYVGIGFAVFASLMLSNFIGTSVAHKKQEIGILRAIGSRSADVFRIFFAESFIIAMINFVLSATLTLAACIVLNGVLRNEAGILITFLSFGVRQIGLLLLVSIGVAFLATFFPVRKIASKKPIDAIKNRK